MITGTCTCRRWAIPCTTRVHTTCQYVNGNVLHIVSYNHTLLVEGTAASHLITHSLIYSCALLADTQPGAEASNQDIEENVVFNAHDLLQLLSPIYHEAAWPKASRENRAAAPEQGSLPEAQDARDGIGVGHSDQGAAQSMNAHPQISGAATDADIEIIFAVLSIASAIPGHHGALQEDGRNSVFVVECCEAQTHGQLTEDGDPLRGQDAPNVLEAYGHRSEGRWLQTLAPLETCGTAPASCASVRRVEERWSCS